MKRFVYANDATGAIVRTIVCPDADGPQYAVAGETFFASDVATASTHRMVNGELVPIPPVPVKSPIQTPPGAV